MDEIATWAARVNRGAALLDKAYPGWRERVDIGILQMHSNKTCILGQVYGGYSKGLRQLEPWGDNSSVHCGFDIPAGIAVFENYHRLTLLWSALLESERAR